MNEGEKGRRKGGDDGGVREGERGRGNEGGDDGG